MYKLFKAFALIPMVMLFISTGHASSLTLKAVLNSFPQIANFKPSPYVLHITKGQAIKNINGKQYELRLCQFELNKPSEFQNKTLRTVIETKKLLSLKAKMRNDGHGKVEYFTSPQGMKKEGIHFLLSLRQQKAEKSP